MDSLIFGTLKGLKVIYIIHIILFLAIFIFNFILVSQIFWLKKILMLLYNYSKYIDIIFIINTSNNIINFITQQQNYEKKRKNF